MRIFNTSASAMFTLGLLLPVTPAHGAATPFTPADCANKSAITEMPEGVLHDNLFRSGAGIYCYAGQLLESMKWDGEIGRIVVNGDRVYVFNPTISGLTNTWFEGRLSADGKQVIVSTPQLVMGSEQDGWAEYLCNLVYDEKSAAGTPDYENRDIIYSYSDGILQLEEGIPALFEWAIPEDPRTWEPIGDTEEWIWSGYADTECRIAPFDHTPLTPPAGMTFDDYVLYSRQAGVTVCRDVRLGINGNEVWVSNLEINDPDIYVKGELHGNTLTFHTQFMCLDDKAHLFQFLLPAKAEFEEGEVEASGYSIAEEVNLTYNPTDGSFAAPADECLFVNGGTVSIYALSLYESPCFRKKSDVEITTPADPVILYYTPYDEEFGSAAISFALPQTDINGNAIPTSRLYYILYDGDEEIELSPELFPNVSEYMVEIPYDWWCYDVVPNGCTRSVYFYFVVDNPGVQLYYETPDGEVLQSARVYASQSGISHVEDGAKTVERLEYFDITGVPANADSPGLIIRRTVYSDGSSHSARLFNR